MITSHFLEYHFLTLSMKKKKKRKKKLEDEQETFLKIKYA